MTNHIPHHLLLPQDLVMVRDTETGVVSRWHATDYKHAASVEPERYVLDGMPQGAPAVGGDPNVKDDDGE